VCPRVYPGFTGFTPGFHGEEVKLGGGWRVPEHGRSAALGPPRTGAAREGLMRSRVVTGLGSVFLAAILLCLLLFALFRWQYLVALVHAEEIASQAADLMDLIKADAASPTNLLAGDARIPEAIRRLRPGHVYVWRDEIRIIMVPDAPTISVYRQAHKGIGWQWRINDRVWWNDAL
jgi:hypothetical protein